MERRRQRIKRRRREAAKTAKTAKTGNSGAVFLLFCSICIRIDASDAVNIKKGDSPRTIFVFSPTFGSNLKTSKKMHSDYPYTMCRSRMPLHDS